MSIKIEVEKNMIAFESSDDKVLTAHFKFPPDFLGFQGHFPLEKVLPGVCQIQCVSSMIERFIGKPVLLKEIVSAKFFAPVLPSEEIICVCRGLNDSYEDFVVKASVSKNGKTVAELKLKGGIGLREK